MGFQFSLATVLTVRRIHEEREERMLQQIQFQITQTRQAVAAADSAIRTISDLRVKEILKPLIGIDMHSSYGKVAQLKHDRQQLVESLEKLGQLREIQVKVYDAARQNREMLTDMQEEKRDSYDSDMERREQKVLDDNFIARRGRG
jgi:flagellar export protein FliJ